MASDRISSLPNNVREHILMFLPLRDAAKSSILSTNWRNMWMDLPTLVFDESFGSQDENVVDKLMFDICTVLLLHCGPLKEFTLSLPVLRKFPYQLDQVLLFLRNKKRLESLTIKEEGYCPAKKYKLSRRLFSFSQLKTLHLSECKVKSSPDEFQGFVNLTVLELKSVIFIDSGSDSSPIWRFRFPLLSSLSLVDCSCKCPSWISTPCIEIEAPKLSCFRFVGEFLHLHFKHTPALRKATLDRKYVPSVPVESAMLDIWGGLAAVESLSVSGRFCEYLEQGIELQYNDLSPLKMLAHMTFRDVCLSRQGLVDTVLLMITSSPNLQRFEIIMQDIPETSVANISFPERLSEFELSRLTKVEVNKLKGAEHELAFIKWLLNSSPALDIMKINLSSKLSDAERILILKDLNRFARASTRALIEIESLN